MENFKYSLVYILIVGCVTKYAEALTDTQKELLKVTLTLSGAKCIKEYPLSVNDMKSFSNKVMPNTDNAKCFAACMFRSVGFMDETGQLTAIGAQDTAKKIFKNDQDSIKRARDILDKCAEVNNTKTGDGNKGCERAKLAFECLMENAPDYGFDVKLS